MVSSFNILFTCVLFIQRLIPSNGSAFIEKRFLCKIFTKKERKKTVISSTIKSKAQFHTKMLRMDCLLVKADKKNKFHILLSF